MVRRATAREKFGREDKSAQINKGEGVVKDKDILFAA
jgi:hypothetical protein